MIDRWDRGLPEREPMAFLDPIRPYLALIRVVLWCLLAAFLFVTGCHRGKTSQMAETAKVQASFEAYQAKMIEATKRVEQAAALAKQQYDLKAAEAIRSYEDGRKSAESREATVVADLRNGNKQLRNGWEACMSRARSGQVGPAPAQADEPAAVPPEAFGRVLRVGDDADGQVQALQALLIATRERAQQCGAIQ